MVNHLCKNSNFFTNNLFSPGYIFPTFMYVQKSAFPSCVWDHVCACMFTWRSAVYLWSPWSHFPYGGGRVFHLNPELVDPISLASQLAPQCWHSRWTATLLWHCWVCWKSTLALIFRWQTLYTSTYLWIELGTHTTAATAPNNSY